MIASIPPWAVLPLVFVGSVLYGMVTGYFQWRREDREKQRLKFERLVRKTGAEWRDRGWVLASVEIRHGWYYGHGLATWRHPDWSDPIVLRNDRL